MSPAQYLLTFEVKVFTKQVKWIPKIRFIEHALAIHSGFIQQIFIEQLLATVHKEDVCLILCNSNIFSEKYQN